jgi:hypothetical protein
VADLAPPSPPLVTRLAQGPLTVETGELADPLDPDRQERDRPYADQRAVPGGDDAAMVTGPDTLAPVGPVAKSVVSA